jgi:hypothetical protein
VTFMMVAGHSARATGSLAGCALPRNPQAATGIATASLPLMFMSSKVLPVIWLTAPTLHVGMKRSCA